MKNNVVSFLILYMIMPWAVFSNDNPITYIWNFNDNNDSTVSKFSESLRIRFEIGLQKCNNTGFVTQVKDTQEVTLKNRSNLQPEYAILIENSADYLIRGTIWRPDNGSPTNVSVKVYSRIDTESIAVSSFQYGSDFVMESRGINCIAVALITEICPNFTIDGFNRLVKADGLINQKRQYLDDYKKMVDSLLKTVKPVEKLKIYDTVKFDKCIHDTICPETTQVNISASNVLIPVYGLVTSIKSNQNILHSIVFNVVFAGSLASGCTLLAMSEKDQFSKNSNRYKSISSSLLVTAAITAVVNGVIAALKIQHDNPQKS